MFETGFAWLLIPTAAALGWALARRGVGTPTGDGVALRREAIAGLSSMARDDADEAIASLNRAIEAEPGAVELQLTLGGLFRKKGEIDRAILVHEGLVGRGGLDAAQLGRVRLALAQDYLKAGVLDRAESHAQALAERGIETQPALELLVDLYEQARDWPRAIETVQRLEAVRGSSMATRVAQYHCELADAARLAKDAARWRAEAAEALSIDAACVRASLLLAAWHEADGDASRAFDHYARVLSQDPAFINESLAGMHKAAEASGRMGDFRDWLKAADELPKPPSAVVIARARMLAARGQAAEYLAERAARGLGGEALLLWLETAGAVDASNTVWTTAKPLLLKRLSSGPRYRCAHCGFSPGMLFWQCPSCKSWSAVRPVDPLA